MTRLTLFALAFTAICYSENQSYFPLAEGNRWEYRDGGTTSVVVEVMAKEVVGGQNWFRIVEMRPGTKYFRDYKMRVDDQGKVWEWQGLMAPAMRLSLVGEDGVPFAVEELCTDSATNTRDGADLVVRYINTCSDGGLLWRRYRSDIGLVEWSQGSYAGPVTFRLVRAHVNGKDVGL